jgi:ABC-type uncharacterized transport system substrate-binding protein
MLNHRILSSLTLAFALVSLVLFVDTAHSQTPGKTFRVGVLINRAIPNPQTDSLREGLAQWGYVEGTNIVFKMRAAEGQLDRLPGFAADRVSQGVDVIVTYGGPPTAAAHKATTTIPIVFTLVADPVAIGVAATLARPGGNLTGVTTHDANLPAQQMALVVLDVPAVIAMAKTVAEVATARRLPSMVWGGEGASGAVMSYGTSLVATYPRMPIFVDQILKGGKPAETAIEVVAQHQLVVHLKTARELGLTVPAELLKRVDRVME